METPKRLDAQTAPETHAIIGALIEVHKALGPGFLEAVYQDAVDVELQLRAIAAAREVPVPVYYKGVLLGAPYRADFVCGSVLVELKAQASIGDVEAAQVIHYLRATGLRVGLLANFGQASLKVKRFVGDFSRPADVSVESV
jgi:GxxExxY protein